MQSDPKVAVVVPVFNKCDFTLRFLDSFRQVRYPNYTMVIVDDGSTDGTAQVLADRYPWVRVLRGNGQLWWSGATNLGVRHALAEGFRYVLTINNDTRVSPDFLGRLVETAEANLGSIVGCRIHFLDKPGTVWSTGGIIRWDIGVVLQLRDHGGHADEVLAGRPNPCPAEALTGCGTLVPADCYRRIGLYDARMCPQYHADSEFVLRAVQHGYQALVDLRALIWNDADNTCTVRAVFSKRSPWYWRPLWAIHWRYCPWRHLPRSLWQQFAPFASGEGTKPPAYFQGPVARTLKGLAKRVLRRSA